MARRPPIRQANAALSEARAYRAVWLLSLSTGQCRIADVIAAAATPGGEPLSRISLRTLLQSDPGLNWIRLEPRVRRTLCDLGWNPSHDHRWPTIGWLLDRRSTGARLAAFLEVLTPSSDSGVPLHVPQ